ncbi:hypothetical protein DFH06DRAFT_1192349 [Mycena polygramma]|nr:hypothetical protein DFH06DRAFT_1192349 [Mycena polygramma]
MTIWFPWKRVAIGRRCVLFTLLLAFPVVGGLLWHLPTRRRHLRRLLYLFWPAPKYNTYKSAVEEDRYWAAAECYGRRLQRSDARFSGPTAEKQSRIPVVSSYTPALLPWYRQRRKKKSPEYYLSLRALCKWHRMVFPGPWHPSVSQAARMRESFAPEDRREIHRISRMLPDELVFGRTARWKPKYRAIWRKWLKKDRQVFVVFRS